jgi:nucleotide-binding universal stress UspA family protein
MPQRSSGAHTHAAAPAVRETRHMDENGHFVVVGVDGSDAAAEALRFAATEARLRGARLRVVHAYARPYTTAFWGGAYLGSIPMDAATLDEIERRAREHAEAELERAITELPAQLADGVAIDRHVVEQEPAAALVEQGAGADLLVVGSRGRGGFKGLLLGSVSQQVSHHATCPVTIVRPAA